MCTNSCCPHRCALTAVVHIGVHQQPLSTSMCTNSCCPILCAPAAVVQIYVHLQLLSNVHICVHKQLLLLSSLNVFSIHGRGQGSTLTNLDRSLRIILSPFLLASSGCRRRRSCRYIWRVSGDGIWRGHDSPLGPHHVQATLEMPRCLSFFLYKETG